MASGRVSTNNYGPSDFIVDGDGLQAGATHTTITAALADMSSGDSLYIRPGIYTEDFTLPVGLNITGLPGSQGNAGVLIVGKVTQTATGNSTLSNIRFQTNSDVILDIGGSGTIQTSFRNCAFFLTNGDGININNSNASPAFSECRFQQAATNLDFYNITSCGTVSFNYCAFTGTATAGVSDIAAGTIRMRYCSSSLQRYTTQTTGNFKAQRSFFDNDTGNLVVLTTAGTGANHELLDCTLLSGTAAALSIGSGTTCRVGYATVRSTNSNPVTGAGTLTYGMINFSDSGNGIDVTTQNPGSIETGLVTVDNLTLNGNTLASTDTDGDIVLSANGAGIVDSTAQDIHAEGISFDTGTNVLDIYEEGTFTPTVFGSSTAGAATYTFREGSYTRIGNTVRATVNIQISAHTGSGTARIDLPFTSANTTNKRHQGSAVYYDGTNYNPLICTNTPNTAYAQIQTVNVSYGAGITIASAIRLYLITIVYQV